MDQSRILLVDDDTDILEINKAFLEGEGYEVSTATNIAQTMEKVQTHNFDCIVLDVMLPDGSAFELPPKIQVYSNAPIIFLTAREQAEDKVTGFKSGADDYITKPYSLPELSLRINAHIRRNMKSEGFLMEYPPLKININSQTGSSISLDFLQRHLMLSFLSRGSIHMYGVTTHLVTTTS